MTTDSMMDLSTVDIPKRPTKIPRSSFNCEFEDLSDDFEESKFGQVDFEMQYASVYFIRLEALRGAIMNSAKARWVDSGRVREHQLVGHVKSYKSFDGDIVLAGVLFKEMSLKPSVLEDIQNNLKISDQFMTYPSSIDVGHQIRETDVLFIEDMEARLQLVFQDRKSLDSLPTGIVVAVLGKINAQGFFEVSDLVLPGCQRPEAISTAQHDPAYVALVSGLQIGSPRTNPLALQLLRDFLMGMSVSDSDRKLASMICRLVIAGDTLVVSTEKDPTASALSEADVYLAQVASVIPVSLMSGPRDPVNYCLPQQPLHSGLFPEARRFGNLTVHTNPFKFRIGKMVMLGTSGQNVTDVVQFTSCDSSIDALELIANARYLAPTAPDTLGCYPFVSSDPLILKDDPQSMPGVIFAGNQPKTESKLLEDGTLRIATVSDFALCPEMLLVNVNDIKDTKLVKFDVVDAL